MKGKRRFRGDFSSKTMKMAYKEENPKMEKISAGGIL